MKRIIKKILGKYYKSPFPAIVFPEKYPFDIKKSPPGYFRSLGPKNPDKVFYVIWRIPGGYGFFANVKHVLRHLKIADQEGMIPVVDFQNFKASLYSEKEVVNNTRNAWEYWFKPVSPFSLDEVYESKNVFFCSGECPPGLENILGSAREFDLYNKYIVLQKYVEDLINEQSAMLKGRVLAVYFRGQDAKLGGNPPTEKQMIKYTDEIMEKYRMDQIFFCSEEQAYVNLFVKRYGKRLVYMNKFRTYNDSAYLIYPRANHRYLLGLEILIDAFLLSKCHGLLHSESNVSEFAMFINRGNYEFSYFIDNGRDPWISALAKYPYEVRKVLPPFLGGLPGKISITLKDRVA